MNNITENSKSKKICITAAGDTLTAMVDPRCGRARFFIIVNPDTLEFEAIANPNIDTTGGAGVQSAQLITDQGVAAVLTGNVGPNAYQALTAAGIEIMTGVSGTIHDAIAQYKQGIFKPSLKPNAVSKQGITNKDK